MQYAIALVTDATPASLEYGDYRGYVVLDGKTGETLSDDNGDWVHADSVDAARVWIAASAGVETDQVAAKLSTGWDDYPGGVWDVTIESD